MFGIMQTLDNGRNDVASGTPNGAFDLSDARTPEPGILAAPLTDGVEQLPPGHLFCTLNSVGNLRILDRAGQLFFRAATPVHLDVVKAPLRELQEIFVVMA